MPEGPEIRYHKEQLQTIIGNTITNIKALSRKRVYIPKKSKIVDVQSKGKLLWIETKDYFIHIHFGLTGWIYIDEKGPYTKYIITLSNNKMIYVDSMRKFTKLRIYKRKTHHTKINNLGIDIFTKEFRLDIFQELLNNKNMMISKFLLDQDKFSGIGNYIRNEALYMAKIHPRMITSKLDNNKGKKLYNSIKYIAYSMLIGLMKENKIKMTDEIKKLKPKKVQYPYKFRIYQRELDLYGQKVTFEMVAGRRTYYVKSRQKLSI